jgi:hypothetical protein
LVSILTAWLGAAPTPLQVAFWRAIPLIPLPVPLLNMICTNVPGSSDPLYCLGRRMLASYPQVPTGYELGINCAVQTYNGQLTFGLIADSHAAPDVTRLRDMIKASFRDLCRAAGIKKAQPKRKMPRKPKVMERPEPAMPEAAIPAPTKPEAAMPEAAELEIATPEPELVGVG